jgi:hypothetical protein
VRTHQVRNLVSSHSKSARFQGTTR